MDSNGNLFGTAGAGGDNGNGVIFELKASGRKFVYQPLYSLAACDSQCADGSSLQTPLVVDTAGNLYGVAAAGGADAGGVTYELLPKAPPAKSTYKIVYAFCAEGGASCTDGQGPSSGLSYVGASTGTLYDGKAVLFGTALHGGATQGGTLFTLSPGKKWTEKVVYSFCGKSGCADGYSPAGALAIDESGVVFGTTAFGGDSISSNSGVLYEVHGKTEVVLHDFCTSNPCKDGTQPGMIGVTQSGAQTLLGATTTGGNNAAGVAYSFDTKRKKEQFLLAFCRKTNCTDGETPSGPLAASGDGSVGLTQDGGRFNAGLLYGLDAKGKETILHSFCAKGGCSDGENPVGNLVVDGHGNIFGVTVHGGDHNSGTVFEFSP